MTLYKANNPLYIPLRKGYSLNSTETKSVQEMEKLEKIGVLVTAIKKNVLCNKCKKLNPISTDNIENYIRCSECGKRVSTHNSNMEKVIEQINYDEIIKRISSLISESGFNFQFDKDRNFWLIKLNDKNIPMLIPRISNAVFITANSDQDTSLFITLTKEDGMTLKNNMNSSQFIEFQQIYEYADIFSKFLIDASTTFDQNYSCELEIKFDKMLEKISFQDFEKFCEDFLNALKENHSKVSSFYSYLDRKKDTVINFKVVRLGGPASSDFHILALSNYLQSGLRPELFGESKRYRKARFTWADFSSAYAHSKGKDTLFLVSTNEVQIEVWNSIIDSKKENKYSLVLLDKDCILILIKCIELEYLMDKYLEN